MKPLDPAARASRPEHDVHLTENVMVPMRDGVRMATDVYRPARAGRPLTDRRPVLLHRTPYNKVETEVTVGQCRFFASRGYVVVNQDCRGCFGSEGDVNFLIPEAEDGADTLAWIRKQEWCDGTVGTFGTSWSGWTQTAMAALSPEGLATMVPNMSGADAHESSVRHGGALELRFLAWAFWHSAKRKAGSSGLGGLGGFFSPPLLCTNTADRARHRPSAALLAAEAHSATSLDPPNPLDPPPFVSSGAR